MKNGILWIDLETTGLDPARCHVLEVAAVATDADFVEVARYSRVICPQVLDLTRIDPVVRKMHADNGLWLEVLTGATLPPTVADGELDDFIRRTFGDERPQIGGSTIGFDREFMRFHLPISLGRCHYRSLDVTALNELARRAWPMIHDARPTAPVGAAHRALPDVLASIETARYYRAELA